MRHGTSTEMFELSRLKALVVMSRWGVRLACVGAPSRLATIGVSPIRAAAPWPAKAKRNQNDADDGDDEPDGKPHAATGHETSRDQIHALPDPHSTKNQSDHADGDQGDAPSTTIHVPQRTLDRLIHRPVEVRKGHRIGPQGNEMEVALV